MSRRDHVVVNALPQVGEPRELFIPCGDPDHDPLAFRVFEVAGDGENFFRTGPPEFRLVVIDHAQPSRQFSLQQQVPCIVRSAVPVEAVAAFQPELPPP